MRIVFMGTPEFAVASLEALVQAKKNVVGVITAPDRKAGRGLQLKYSAVKEFALKNNLPLLQPIKLKDPEFLSALKEWKADLQIVVAFRMLPEVVWKMPHLGTFNLHASLLPQYRGAAPINWAIMNGEKETGVSTFFLKHEIDTGDILMQKTCKIEENDNAGSLHDKLMNIGSKLLLETTNRIENGQIEAVSQAQVETTNLKEAPKIFKEDCKINWKQSLHEIDCFIRGLSPYPTAYFSIKNKEDESILSVKVFSINYIKGERKESQHFIQDKNSLSISHSEGIIELKDIQIQGKKRMLATAAINGFNFMAYEILD